MSCITRPPDTPERHYSPLCLHVPDACYHASVLIDRGAANSSLGTALPKRDVRIHGDSWRVSGPSDNDPTDARVVIRLEEQASDLLRFSSEEAGDLQWAPIATPARKPILSRKAVANDPFWAKLWPQLAARAPNKSSLRRLHREDTVDELSAVC